MSDVQSPFLRRVIAVDAAACAVSGALMAFAAQPLAALTGLQPELTQPAGGFLLVWAALLGFLATRPVLPRAVVWTLIGVNVLWVVESALVLMAGCILTVGTGLLLGPMLGSGSLFLIWAFLSLGLVMMGLVYGPLGAFLPSLFPARVRYTGVSVAFNVGGILGGGLTPMAAQALADRGGLTFVGFYLSAAALISFLALLALKPKPDALD